MSWNISPSVKFEAALRSARVSIIQAFLKTDEQTESSVQTNLVQVERRAIAYSKFEKVTKALAKWEGELFLPKAVFTVQVKHDYFYIRSPKWIGFYELNFKDNTGVGLAAFEGHSDEAAHRELLKVLQAAGKE